MSPAEQILNQILQAVFGSGTPGSQLVFDGRKAEYVIEYAARRLAEPANNAQARSLARFCQLFIKAYRGCNYNADLNGERWLLGQLAAFQPAIIFDVGSHHGDWLAVARAELPEAVIHAFEIIEETSAALHERMAAQPRVVINRCGLSDRCGTLNMRVFECNSKLATHTDYPHGTHRDVECFVRTGDDYLAEHGIERIDFLKLDVEGAEQLVLAGFAQALDAGRIDIIQFEYGKAAILTHFLLKDFYDLLEGKGYHVGKLYPDHVDFRPYQLEDEDFLGPNYLAVRGQRSEIIAALSKPEESPR